MQIDVFNCLVHRKYIHRALKLYEKNYDDRVAKII